MKKISWYLIGGGIAMGIFHFFSVEFLQFIISKNVGIPLILFTFLLICLGISFRFIESKNIVRKKAEIWMFCIGLFLIVFGVNGKFFNNWIGSNFEIMAGVFILCFGYGPLLVKRRLLQWLPYSNSKSMAVALALTDFLSVTLLFLGILFWVMAWPGSNHMLYTGLPLLFISIRAWNGVFKNEVVLRKTAEEKIIAQKIILEEKNHEITESIQYAKRIQSSVLPFQKFEKAFPKSFILYKPKDIVSGDFFWLAEKNNSKFIAICDCTGHGVPGALVSIVCNNALNKVVNELNQTHTSDILTKTKELVVENFASSNEKIMDGMDVSLARFDFDDKKLMWSGANLPLWYFSNGDFYEIKPDKQSIGFTTTEAAFGFNELKFLEGDRFYFFTDGYADQFGGEKNKKLTRKRFKEIIISIQEKPMIEQKSLLEKFIVEYMNGYEQIDDILVVGIEC